MFPPESMTVLSEIVIDPNEDKEIIAAAGESLFDIWKRKNKRDEDLLSRMQPEALKFWES